MTKEGNAAEYLGMLLRGRITKFAGETEVNGISRKEPQDWAFFCRCVCFRFRLLLPIVVLTVVIVCFFIVRLQL